MLEGARTGVLPPIQTFGSGGNSTNSVQSHFEGASRLPDLQGRVEISDMTWEQKEQVHRSTRACWTVSFFSTRGSL